MIKMKTKRIVMTLLPGLLLWANGLTAEDGLVIQQRGFIRVSPLYQSWSDDGDNRLSEVSIPIFFYAPLGENLSMSLRGSQASIKSDMSPELGGMTDTQINLSYYLESSKIVLHTGVNLPTGKKELTLEEFETSYLISLNMYDFQVHSLGQGLNISPGVSWASPLSENVVLGLGASYQYRGPFRPFENMTGQYDPGDEILLTGGLDFRLSETSTFSTDVIFTTFGIDKLNEEETFQSGHKIVFNAQLRMYFDYNELWLFGQYRSKDKNKIAVAGGLDEEDEKTIPDQVELMGRYRMLLGKGFYASIIAEGRFFNETKVFNRISIYGLGTILDIPVSTRMNMPVRFKYLNGRIKGGSSLSGIEVGVGLDWSF